MQKLFLSLVFIISSSLFSMSKEDLNDQLLLEIKCEKIKYDKIKYLIEKGANPNVKVDHSTPAIEYCFRRGIWQLFELLIESGADINAKNYLKERNIAMYFIDSIYNSLTIYPLGYLIKKGLDINAVDEDGNNLLHILLLESYHLRNINAYTNLISFLIYKGIDIRKRNNHGQSAVTLAANCSQKVRDIFSDYDSFIRNATSLETSSDLKSSGQLYQEHQEHQKKLNKEKKSKCVIL